MVCYLIRHGKDDETVRGGWSNHSLTAEGVEQVELLGAEILERKLSIGHIYSSDLQRAKETAQILKRYSNCPVTYCPEFREADNGELAGMKHELANEKYPGIYWNTLDYEVCYPGGESPKQFFERVRTGWEKFKQERKEEETVALVTHGGVIEVILCIENGVEFSNRVKNFSTPGAKLIPVVIK